jgi:hypothetical protein
MSTGGMARVVSDGMQWDGVLRASSHDTVSRVNAPAMLEDRKRRGAASTAPWWRLLPE